MQQIDRAGTFRGLPLEWGVSETKNGFPQFTVRLKAVEFYAEAGEFEAGNPPETGYVPWEQFDQTIDGYLVLYTKDAQGQWKELMNAAQLKKVFGWDGLTFESLAAGKYAETMVLFRVEEHEFNGKTTLKLQWIDTADANPVRQLPKYDTAKLKGLTARMGGALAATAQAPTPAKAPIPAKAPVTGGTPAVPPKGKPGRKPKPADPTPTAGSPAVPSTATPPPASPAPAPSVPSGSPPPPNPAPSTTPVTKESAWEVVNALNDREGKKVIDEKLAEIWIAEGAKIGKAESAFTSADWATVQEAVIQTISTF